MQRHSPYRTGLRFAAAVVLGAWALLALHTLEHHAHGTQSDHPECVACAAFWGVAVLSGTVALALSLLAVFHSTTLPRLRGTRLPVRPTLRGPPCLPAA